MPLGLIPDPSPTDIAAVGLRTALDHFYATAVGYSAFESTTDRNWLYSAALNIVKPGARDPIRILELGAGRTGFSIYLRESGIAAEFDAQDVTLANIDYLRPLCRSVHIGDSSGISGTYDLILSSYVFEHIVCPRAFLENADRLLAPGGWHIIVCPRYDAPGYLCPSLRDRSFFQRALLKAFLAASRLAARVDRRPRFWVNSKPSVLGGPWYRDADAVHLVSRYDAVRWHRQRGYRIRTIESPRLGGWRNFLVRNFLTLSLAFQKPKL